jgi:hypothetical protein
MATTRPGRRPLGTYTARLSCDIVLTYEAPSFVPEVGQVVPCRRHGFCAVRSRDEDDAPDPRRAADVTRRRSQNELLRFLHECQATSVHALRHNRFPLRLVVAAQRQGIVDVDLITGRVALRAHIDMA